MTAIHMLKVDESLWGALIDGSKKAEFRRNDRAYQLGDTLHLYPVNKIGIISSGQGWKNFTVSHIVHGPEFGIPEGYCMMSLAPYYSVPH